MVFAQPLRAEEQAWLAGVLDEEPGLRLFWSQPTPDLRHSHDVARWVADREPARRDLQVAALLHDVGKRHAQLGALGRTLATLLRGARIPEESRPALYTRHGPIGANELRRAGYTGIVVEFAAHHHGERSPDVDDADWDLLLEADHRR